MIKNPFATKKLDDQIKEWSDEECLENFAKFLGRVGIVSEFIRDDEDEMFTHERLHIFCGDQSFTSDPQELEWPLQMLPMPEAFKGALN